jgi:sulfate transport system permease protein
VQTDKLNNNNRILPGFGLTLGFSLVYLSILVMLPVSALFLKLGNVSWDDFLKLITSARVVAAFKLSFLSSFYAALINALFGLLIAWVLARYSFPGRRLVDSLIDLPFALPTAVAGIALTSIYSRVGFIGSILKEYDIKVAYTPLGIMIAMIFVGLPFVVRTVQPVIESLKPELEEASFCMGANRFVTFIKVIFPLLLPALITGFALAFARGLGEYGSVVFIAGNMPMKTEILPLLVMSKLEQFDYNGAVILSVAMLTISFSIMLAINFLTLKVNKKLGIY